MKRLTSTMERWFSQRFPFAYYQMVQRPRFYFRFSTERKLAGGARLSHSNRQSIIFFTTQKCASRYVSRVLDRLSRDAGLVHADYDAYVTTAKIPAEVNPFKDAMPAAFVPQGYYYGPIGTFRKLPNLADYKLVLQLRDPRDVLTSLYYSTAFSHAVISPKLARRRSQAKDMNIDEFVLYEVDEYLRIYENYCRQLLPLDNTLFLKYEDMVSNFPAWLSTLAEYTGLADQRAAIQELIQQADFSVAEEEKFSQRRQVTPGDHKRKLQPETIKELTSAFSWVLKQLHYPQ